MIVKTEFLDQECESKTRILFMQARFSCTFLELEPTVYGAVRLLPVVLKFFILFLC